MLAQQGLYAQPPEEAIYYKAAFNSARAPLAGDVPVTVTFNPVPPVTAFWSLTAYNVSSGLFFDNPINRYSISNRVSVVVRDDGTGSCMMQAWVACMDVLCGTDGWVPIINGQLLATPASSNPLFLSHPFGTTQFPPDLGPQVQSHR